MPDVETPPTEKPRPDMLQLWVQSLLSRTVTDPSGKWKFPRMQREAAAQLVDVLTDEIGMSRFRWPARTPGVLSLAVQLDYQVSEETPGQLTRQGLLEPVAFRQKVGKSWSPEDCAAFLSILEFRERWRPLSPRHQHKLSVWRRLRELHETGLEKSPDFESLKQWEICDLLRVMNLAEGRSPRNACYEALLHKLRITGVDIGENPTAADVGFDEEDYLK